MASTNYVMFTAKIDATSPDDVTIDVASGATLVGANAVLNVNFDEAVFTSSTGRTSLILALEAVVQKLKESNTTWPLT